MVLKFKVGLKSLLQQGLSEPEFNGDLIYKLRKIVSRADLIFLISSEKLSCVTNVLDIGVGRGGQRGASPPPPNNLRGGQHTLWSPNNPPTFSFNSYVKQEKSQMYQVEG